MAHRSAGVTIPMTPAMDFNGRLAVAPRAILLAPPRAQRMMPLDWVEVLGRGYCLLEEDPNGLIEIAHGRLLVKTAPRQGRAF
jgi:hypothetical protein